MIFGVLTGSASGLKQELSDKVYEVGLLNLKS